MHEAPRMQEWATYEAGSLSRPEMPAHGHPCVFLYSHDTFGLGHLRRNLAIAERLLASGAFTVHLLTGSPVIRQWRLPEGLHVHPLPPVVKTGAERYAPREPGQSFGLVKGYREALIVTLVLRHRPDFFLVDHAPMGMNGELLAAVALMRREMPRTRVMLGLRDILDSPETVRGLWQEQDVYTYLEHAYDDVLVYGDQALFDVVEAYGIAAPVADRVRYCGHVVAADGKQPLASLLPARPCWDEARAGGRPVVLVTAGGGGDGFALMQAYLRGLAQMPAGATYSAIVTGPLMSGEQRDALALAAQAARGDVELIEYTTDLLPSLRAAELVIAMAGYNTSAEIIAARKRAILVPRPAPRAEQRLRAGILARHGLVTAIEQGPLLAEALAEAVPACLAAPPPAAAAWDSMDLDGAERVAAYLVELLSTAPRHDAMVAAGAV